MNKTPTDDAYREAARRLYGSHDVSVSSWAAIQRCADGAFVELVAWVSQEALTRIAAMTPRQADKP